MYRKNTKTFSFLISMFLIGMFWCLFIFNLTSCTDSGKISDLENQVSELQKQISILKKEKLSGSKKILNKSTLEIVKTRGFIKIGVNQSLYGFGMPDASGKWKGLDVDTGRAISAAIFGDPDKVEFIALTGVQRLPALQSGEIDVLCRNTTQTLTRETQSELNFVHPNYYDGQGFMIHKKLNKNHLKELEGARICVLPGTTTKMNVADYFRANNMTWKPVVIESGKDLAKAFFSGKCDCLTSDASQLAAVRSQSIKPDQYIILPDIISKEPLAPVVRHGDDQWYDIVNWTVMALIQAEEYGINSQNIDQMVKNDNPEIKRFLGATPGMGSRLGLDDKWAYHIIKTIGNYGEIFNKNVGPDTPLGLQRGLNALWIHGGLMYSAPIR